MAKKTVRLQKKSKLNTKIKRRVAKGVQDSGDAIMQASQYARSLLEASLDPLVTINPEGKITDVNEATIKVTGNSREELIGSDFSNYFTEPEKAREGYQQVFAKGSVTDYPLTIRHKAGKLTDVLYNASVYKDIKGNVLGVFAAARDVTAQKQASQYARSLLEASLDPLVTINPEGKITDVNEATIKVTGNSREELIGSDFSNYFTEPEKAREGYQQVFAKGSVTDYPLTIRHKAGKLTDVLYNASIYKDINGNVLGVFAAARDVTAQKQAEYLRGGQIALSEKMRGEQSISRLGQSILSLLVPFTNAQVGAFYLVTDNKKLQMASSHAIAKTQASEKFIEFGDGLIGQVAIDRKTLLIDDVPSSYFNKIESAMGALVPRSLLICPVFYENEVVGVIELGSLHAFTEHQRNFLTSVSENIGIAINTSDVRKKVEIQNEALNKAQILLEEKANEVHRASQYKTEFLANMSHELRTPLNSSLILAKLLMDNSKANLTKEQIQYATSIYSSGNDLLNLINDILDLSKVEAGKLEIRVEKIPVFKIIENLKQTFKSGAQQRNLVFEVMSEVGMPQAFLTDRQRLDQILKNLISNALKFTEHGSVNIRLFRHSNGMIGFEVKDTGIGIPKEQQSIIFEAFRQADGTTNRKYGGTGLGLSISRDLANLLGGHIEVESVTGQGSSFTLVIPETLNGYRGLNEPSPSESIFRNNTTGCKDFVNLMPLPFEDDRNNLAAGDITVLVVEDDIGFAKILFDLAHELNFKCIVGQGADEGYEMAIQYLPTAIILDMKLPDHFGLTVLDRLKKNSKTRHIPVQVISVLDQGKASLQMGAIGFHRKPIAREEIAKAFKYLEAKILQKTSRIMITGSDKNKFNAIATLIGDDASEIVHVAKGNDAISLLKANSFDCIIMDLTTPSQSSLELLDLMSVEKMGSPPTIIIYSTGKIPLELEVSLRNAPYNLTLKSVNSPERLFDEIILVLHRDEEKLSQAERQMIKLVRNREQTFEGKKILLVDDDVRNIFALTSALEQKGAVIVVGRNGREALEKLELDPQIDLVLMDLMMPEMDGYEATRRIRKQKRFVNLPIIVVTAKAMKDDQEKCLEVGANDYVSKPVDLEKLLSLIRVWMPMAVQ